MDTSHYAEEQIIYRKLGGILSENEQSIEENVASYGSDLAEAFSILEENKEISASRSIFPGLSGGSKVKTLIKKVVRKCLTWYLKPICDQQTEFNCAVLEILSEIVQQHETGAKDDISTEDTIAQFKSSSDKADEDDIAKSN